MSDYAEVRIQWLSTKEGGREGPVCVRSEDATISKAYKPHFRVGDDGEYLGIAFIDGEPDLVKPGQVGTAKVELFYDRVDYSELVPGAHFRVVEGPNTVGTGIVLRRYVADGP